MIATVDLSESELAELRDLTKTGDAQAAVRRAIDEFRRYALRMQLKTLSGKVVMENYWGAL